jgi:5'-3' exonuclease
MDFIRHERSKPDYDHNVRHCLYGLDADLVSIHVKESMTEQEKCDLLIQVTA